MWWVAARTLWFSFVVIALGHAAAAAELPQPPDGYTWAVVEESRSAYLKPNGWFERRESTGGTTALFLTKEDISVSGMFLTGFSANYIRGVTSATGLSPTAYVAAFIQATERKYEVVRRPWFDTIETDLRGAGIRTRRGSGTDAYVVQYYLIADELAGTVTLLSFEAPESEWDEAWKHGKLMLNAVGWR